MEDQRTLHGGQSTHFINKRLFACEDGGKLDVIDAETGKILQSKVDGRRLSSVVYGDGKFTAPTRRESSGS